MSARAGSRETGPSALRAPARPTRRFALASLASAAILLAIASGVRATDVTVTRLTDIAAGSAHTFNTAAEIGVFGDSAIFTAPGGLWRSDGTPAGTVIITSPMSGGHFTDVAGVLFFVGGTGSTPPALWRSDGTAGGTVSVKQICPTFLCQPMAALTNVGGTLFFQADDGVHGSELWKSDGTEAGTLMVKEIQAGEANLAGLTDLNGLLLFSAVDGFDAADHGREIWRSDGTAAGTILVKDIWPGPSSGSMSEPTVVNDVLFFTANDGVHGEELWRTDGTEAGTTLVKDINPSGSSLPGDLVNVGGTLFFHATDGVNGREIWKSDGTEAGTMLVKDIVPGSSGLVFPGHLTDLDGTLVFSTGDGVHGTELWRSDGTVDGTILVKDIRPGSSSSAATELVDVNGTLFFRADDGVAGSELWQSDGTDGGTTLVADINPGSAGSAPVQLTPVGPTLFFIANDGTHGRELWAAAGNQPPTIEPIAGQAVDEGSLLTVDAVVSDAEGDSFTITWDGLPDGASASGATLTWTPSEDQGPGAYEVTVRATQTDGGALEASRTFEISVSEVNEAPVLDPIADVTVAAGGTVEVTATASDPDVPANDLAFSILSGPAGAAIDPETGAFSWVACACPGDHPVEVSVSDGDLSDTESFVITVESGDDVVAPSWTNPSLIVTAVSAHAFSISWSGAADDVGVTAYEVFVDGVLSQTVPAPQSSTTVSGLTPDTTYEVKVEALDAAGNRSDDGPTASVTTASATGGGHLFPAASAPGIGWQAGWPTGDLDIARRLGQVVVVASTGTTEPIRVAMTPAVPTPLDIDGDGTDDALVTLSLAPGPGASPEIHLTVDRLGFPGPTDVQIVAFVPLPDELSTATGKASLAVGFGSLAVDGTAGGLLPTRETIVASIDQVGGLVHRLALRFETTDTPNPLVFYLGTGEGDGSDDGTTAASLFALETSPVPSWIEIGFGTDVSSLTDPAATASASLDWRAPPGEPEPTIVAFYLESEQAPRGTSADADTRVRIEGIDPETSLLLTVEPDVALELTLRHDDPSTPTLDRIERLQLEHVQGGLEVRAAIVEHPGPQLEIRFDDATGDITVDSPSRFGLEFEARRPGGFFGEAFSHPVEWIYGAARDVRNMTIRGADAAGVTVIFPDSRANLIFVAADSPDNLRYPAEQAGWPDGSPTEWAFEDFPGRVLRFGLVDDAEGTTLAVTSTETPSFSIAFQPETLGQAVELNPIARTRIDVAAELGPGGLSERAVELGCGAFVAAGPLGFDLDSPSHFLLRSGGGDALNCYGQTGTKSLILKASSIPPNLSIDLEAAASEGSLEIRANDLLGESQPILNPMLVLTDGSGLTGVEPLGAPARYLALGAVVLPSLDITWSHQAGGDLAFDAVTTTPEDRIEDLRFVLATTDEVFSEPFTPEVDLPDKLAPPNGPRYIFLPAGTLGFNLWELPDVTLMAAAVTSARSLGAVVSPGGGSTLEMELAAAVPLRIELVLPLAGHFLPAAAVTGLCTLAVPGGTSALVVDLPGAVQLVTDAAEGFASLVCDQDVVVPVAGLNVNAKLDAVGVPGDTSLALDLPAATMTIGAQGPIESLTLDVRDMSTGGLPIASPFAHPIATLAFRADEVRSLAGSWSFSPGELEIELEATPWLAAAQVLASTATLANPLADPGVRHLVHVADQGDLLVTGSETPGRGEILVTIHDLERVVVSHRSAEPMPTSIDLQTGQPRALDFDLFFDFDSPYAPKIPPGIPLQVTAEGRVADVSTATRIQTNGVDQHLITGADGADLTAHLVLDDDRSDEGDDDDLSLELFVDARGLPSSFGLSAFDFSPSRTPVQGGFLQLSDTLPWLDLVLRDARRAGVLETGSQRIRIHVEQAPRRVSFLLEDRLDASQTGFFAVRGINDGRLGTLLIESDAASPNRPHFRTDFARITAELTDVPPTFDLLLNAQGDELDGELTFRDGAVPGSGPDADDRIGRVELLLEREARPIDEDRGSPYDIYDGASFTSLERSPFVRAVDDAYWPDGVRDRLALAETGFALTTVLRRVGSGADGESAVFRTVGTDDHVIIRLDERGETLTPDEVQLIAIAVSNIHAVTIAVAGPDTEASVVRPVGTGAPPLYVAIEELQMPRYDEAPDGPKLAKADKDAPPVQNDRRVHHIENGPLFEMTIDVLANDGDVDPATLTVTHQPDFAVALVTADGRILYSPLLVSPANAFRVGWDRFIYRVCAPDGGCAEAEVKVLVRETFMGGTYARITELPDEITISIDGHFFLDPASRVLVIDRVGYTASSAPGGLDVYTGPRTMPPQSVPPALRIHGLLAPTALSWDLTQPSSYLFRYKADVTGGYDLAGVRATAEGRTWFGAQGDANFEVGGSATGLIGSVLQGQRAAEEFRGCDRVLGIDTCVNLLGIAATGSASGSGISGFFSYAPATETTIVARKNGAAEQEYLPLITLSTRALQSLEGSAQLQFDPFKVPQFEVEGKWRSRFDALALDLWARGAEGASIVWGVGAFDVPLLASYDTGTPLPVIRMPVRPFDPYGP